MNPRPLFSLRPVGYVVAACATAAAAAACRALDPALGPSLFLMPFVVPVLLAAWCGGGGAGACATALGAAAVAALFNDPVYRGGAADPARVGLLVGVGALVSLACESAHRRRRRAEAALGACHALLRLATDHAPVLLLHCDRERRHRFVNRAYAERFGLDPQEVLGKTVPEVLGPAGYDRIRERLDAALAGRAVEFETDMAGPGGGPRRVRCTCRPVVGAGGLVDGLVAAITDVTDRTRAEVALRDSEERFRAAMEASLDAVYFLSAERGPGGAITDFRFAELNRRGAELVRRPREQVLGRRLCELLPVSRTGGLFDRYARVAETGEPLAEDLTLGPDDGGAARWLRHQVVRLGDGVAVTTQDVTARKRSEELVLASLREKEVLLKEIHHRVKNNLQIVSALLDLQSEHTADPHALALFQESRGRVKSMALIHERLYRSADLARVDFSEYARQLADDLYRTYKVSGDDVRLELAVTVPPLPIDIAIPCGLLLNELMSNCFKHAFRDGAAGRIRVSLHRDGGANVLTVADDGTGFPAGTDFRNTASFGLQLVGTLVDQLGGAAALSAARGTTFTIRFPAQK